MSLRIGDLTVLNVLIWKAFVQSYIEKTVSSLIFAHQCMCGICLADELEPVNPLPPVYWLLDEWCNIPQDQVDNLTLSMPRRFKACIASPGRHTPY
ncbi:uncharacterized protein TNCV_935901 [Trichonephila clavipes]|nr:uncharacterized protein TNCV_935901 [Trichonephila clavipes]